MTLSPIVDFLLRKWKDIDDFCNENVKSWRQLKIERISEFSLQLVNELRELHGNSPEFEITDNEYYDTWKTIGLVPKGDPRNTWYFPYSLIEASALGIHLEDMLSSLELVRSFIGLPLFINHLTRLKSKVSVNFKDKEIEFIHLVFEERNDKLLGILSYEELGALLDRRGSVSGVQDRKRYFSTGFRYWKNLERFFYTNVVINHGKVGLYPIVIKHSRQLTPLEKEYCMFSFFSQNNYYSLLFLPLKSNWIEENTSEEILENQGENSAFSLLGEISHSLQGWNLNHFTKNRTTRWGNYLGISGTAKDCFPALHFPCKTKQIDGFQKHDFKIISALSRTAGRTKTISERLGVSISYVTNRIKLLLTNKVIHTNVGLVHCGTDSGMFLLVLADEPARDFLTLVINDLTRFPNYTIYYGDKVAFARIQMPSRWAGSLFTEIDELSSPGGLFFENGIRALLTNYRTEHCIHNPLDDFQRLAVLEKNGVAINKLQWSFELPIL